MTTAADATDRVGKFEMRVVPADRTPESDERWAHRSESLAAWLLSRWRLQQQAQQKEAC